MEEFMGALGMFLRDLWHYALSLLSPRQCFLMLWLLCGIAGVVVATNWITIPLFVVSFGALYLAAKVGRPSPRFIAAAARIAALERDLCIGEPWDVETELARREHLAQMPDPFGRPTAAQAVENLARFLAPPPARVASPNRIPQHPPPGTLPPARIDTVPREMEGVVVRDVDPEVAENIRTFVHEQRARKMIVPDPRLDATLP